MVQLQVAGPRKGDRAAASTRTPSTPLRRHTTRWRNGAAPTLFLAPALILIVVLRIVPAVAAIGDSTRRGLPGSINPPRNVGLAVFADLLRSPSFWQTVRQTLTFNGLVNPIQIVLAPRSPCY